MKTTASDVDYRLLAESSRKNVYRQYRNWRDGVLIEVINDPDAETTDWWDKEYQSVVLFHCPAEHIVFCDPLTEVLKKGPRYDTCRVIRLDEFMRLVDVYGGENTHGPMFYKTNTNLTTEDLITINTVRRSELLSVMRHSW